MTSPLPREYTQEWTPIQDLEVNVPEGLFIPRIATEEWVKESFSLISIDSSTTFVDLCAGTGLISLLLAKQFPNHSIIALDINPLSQSTIRKNTLHNSLDKIEVYESNLFSDSPLLQQPWILYCNPPYVPDSDRKLVVTNNIAYEPSEAIFGGGHDGLDFFKKILKDIQHIPAPQVAFFELDPRNIQAALELAEQTLKLTSAKIIIDSYGFKRTLVLYF